ncbi:hypothetical protein HJG60_009987 [Phyllostomus discolor]|uniref:Uncharacterized protein n=1 Tax=Phyllostomus discolor TaxID=89673 RepID=A0A834B7B2_9CHIR|nr:hypothetical protein HJG60_009987 [Phyllostomus discolor]
MASSVGTLAGRAGPSSLLRRSGVRDGQVAARPPGEGRSRESPFESLRLLSSIHAAVLLHAHPRLPGWHSVLPCVSVGSVTAAPDPPAGQGGLPLPPTSGLCGAPSSSSPPAGALASSEFTSLQSASPQRQSRPANTQTCVHTHTQIYVHAHTNTQTCVHAHTNTQTRAPRHSKAEAADSLEAWETRGGLCWDSRTKCISDPALRHSAMLLGDPLSLMSCVPFLLVSVLLPDPPKSSLTPRLLWTVSPAALRSPPRCLVSADPFVALSSW